MLVSFLFLFNGSLFSEVYFEACCSISNTIMMEYCCFLYLVLLKRHNL